MSATTTTREGQTVRTVPSGRTAVRLAFVGLVIGTIGDRVLGFWHPEPDSAGAFSYRFVAGMRDTWWGMHFFGSMAVSLEAVTFAALVLVLIRDRGVRWAATGAALLTIGGLFFAAGLAGEGVVDATAVDPSACRRQPGPDCLLTWRTTRSGTWSGSCPGWRSRLWESW